MIDACAVLLVVRIMVLTGMRILCYMCAMYAACYVIVVDWPVGIYQYGCAMHFVYQYLCRVHAVYVGMHMVITCILCRVV